MKVQGPHVHVRVKGKAGGSKEAWTMGKLEALFRKQQETWDRYRQLGSSVYMEEFQELESILTKEIRRAISGRK